LLITPTKGVTSLCIRLLTLSPVNHAALYLSNDEIAEAVGSGIRVCKTAKFFEDEFTIVVFRHPGGPAAHARGQCALDT
jgi:uncharacterized protein YycO